MAAALRAMRQAFRRGDLHASVQAFLGEARRCPRTPLPLPLYQELLRTAARMRDSYLALSALHALRREGLLPNEGILRKLLHAAGPEHGPQVLAALQLGQGLPAPRRKPNPTLQKLRRAHVRKVLGHREAEKVATLLAAWEDWLKNELGHVKWRRKWREALPDAQFGLAMRALGQVMQSAGVATRVTGDPKYAQAALRVFGILLARNPPLPLYIFESAFEAQWSTRAELHEVRAMATRLDRYALVDVAADSTLLRAYISAIVGWQTRDGLEDRLAEAQLVLDKYERTGTPLHVGCYNAYGLALARLRNPRRMAQWLQTLLGKGVRPDSGTYTAMLESCLLDDRDSLLEPGIVVDLAESFLEHMKSEGVQSSTVSALRYISVLAHAGEAKRGIAAVAALPADVKPLGYRALIQGLARNPRSDMWASGAFAAAEAAQSDSVEMDEASFNNLLVACKRTGQVARATSLLSGVGEDRHPRGIGLAAIFELHASVPSSVLWESSWHSIVDGLRNWLATSRRAGSRVIPAVRRSLRALRDDGKEEAASTLEAMLMRRYTACP